MLTLHCNSTAAALHWHPSLQGDACATARSDLPLTAPACLPARLLPCPQPRQQHGGAADRGQAQPAAPPAGPRPAGGAVLFRQLVGCGAALVCLPACLPAWPSGLHACAAMQFEAQALSRKHAGLSNLLQHPHTHPPPACREAREAVIGDGERGAFPLPSDFPGHAAAYYRCMRGGRQAALLVEEVPWLAAQRHQDQEQAALRQQQQRAQQQAARQAGAAVGASPARPGQAGVQAAQSGGYCMSPGHSAGSRQHLPVPQGQQAPTQKQQQQQQQQQPRPPFVTPPLASSPHSAAAAGLRTHGGSSDTPHIPSGVRQLLWRPPQQLQALQPGGQQPQLPQQQQPEQQPQKQQQARPPRPAQAVLLAPPVPDAVPLRYPPGGPLLQVHSCLDGELSAPAVELRCASHGLGAEARDPACTPACQPATSAAAASPHAPTLMPPRRPLPPGHAPAAACLPAAGRRCAAAPAWTA